MRNEYPKIKLILNGERDDRVNIVLLIEWTICLIFTLCQIRFVRIAGQNPNYWIIMTTFTFILLHITILLILYIKVFWTAVYRMQKARNIYDWVSICTRRGIDSSELIPSEGNMIIASKHELISLWITSMDEWIFEQSILSSVDRAPILTFVLKSARVVTYYSKLE